MYTYMERERLGKKYINKKELSENILGINTHRHIHTGLQKSFLDKDHERNKAELAEVKGLKPPDSQSQGLGSVNTGSQGSSIHGCPPHSW